MFIRLALVLLFTMTAFAEGQKSTQPFARLTEENRSYSYTLAVLDEAGGGTRPARVERTFLLHGSLNGRIAVWHNSLASDVNPLGLVMELNGAYYFAPIHFNSLSENPVFTRVRAPDDSAGIYMTVRGTRFDPFTQRSGPISVRLKVSTVDGQPLNELSVEEYDPQTSSEPNQAN